MRLLLHVCCGPCALFPLEDLRGRGFEVTCFYYNPNIHPYREYEARRAAAEEAARSFALPFQAPEYRPAEYFRMVAFREEERCRFCYYLRLERTAAVAREEGFPAFSTTLLVSPWQRHELIRELGEAVAKAQGVEFFYHDWRPGFSEGRRRARELGLYRQQYCGCIFSEEERFGGGKKSG